MAVLEWDRVLWSLAESIKDTLKKLKNKDLVDYCLNEENIRKVAEDYLKNCIIHKKSESKNSIIAENKKEEGNKKYKEQKYDESLLLYTESIFYGDKNSDCLSLAYSNRSLVLLKMGLISECLQDIDMALNTGYPKDKMKKLMLRKDKCLSQLNEIDKYNSSNQCEVSVQLLENPNQKKASKELEFQLPEPFGGKNENFMNASKHLSVFYTSNKGRHVIATTDIEMGEVLFVEKPFAYVLFKEVCQGCCKKIKAPVPCWNCLDVSYCSSKCRDEFWKSVHSFECGYHYIFKSIGIAHLSLRIILSASSSFSELKCILAELKEPKYEDGVVFLQNHNYESVFNLTTNFENYETSDMFQYVMTAVLLALFLKNYTNYFSESSGEKELKLLTSILLRHILQLICNGHAIVDTFFNESQGQILNETEERIGTAIYPSASMMNHSCEPSITNSFYKDYLIVRASKFINKGDEVFNCYGPHARRMKKAERQEILKKQYFFQCDCLCCSQSIDIQEIFAALKCQNCEGPGIPAEEKFICLECQQTWLISKETLKKQELFSLLIKQGELHLENDINLAFMKFLDGWLLGRKIYYKFHKDLSCAADKVAKCLAMMQDYKKCIMFLKCSALSVEKRFGSFSIELAREMMKIGDAVTNYTFNSNDNDKREIILQGVDYYEKAQKIIKIFYGFYHPDLQEIEEKIAMLKINLKNC